MASFKKQTRQADQLRVSNPREMLVLKELVLTCSSCLGGAHKRSPVAGHSGAVRHSEPLPPRCKLPFLGLIGAKIALFVSMTAILVVINNSSFCLQNLGRRNRQAKDFDC